VYNTWGRQELCGAAATAAAAVEQQQSSSRAAAAAEQQQQQIFSAGDVECHRLTFASCKRHSQFFYMSVLHTLPMKLWC
jgi:hypothetical protein